MPRNESLISERPNTWGCPQGEITIFWEWKEAGNFAVAVEADEKTVRLPLSLRRYLVTRIREKLIPCKTDKKRGGVDPIIPRAEG